MCPETFGANMGSLYARLAGTNHPQTGMPRNAIIFPRAVKEEGQPPLLQFGDFMATGELPKAYAPFTIGGGGNQLQSNMKLELPRGHLDDRASLLANLDRIKRGMDVSGQLDGMDQFQQQALDTIVGGGAEAFDLSKEDPRTVARYDTGPLMGPDDISRRWNNHKWYVDNAETLGKLLLMARRLCEAGCGFVTVTTGFVWDMHSDANNAPMVEGLSYASPPLDKALSALIEDLEARGLDDKILLVVCGEMGRSPKVNAKGGRDHWGNLGPLLLYGGGLRMGQVVGQSSSDGGNPATKPVGISNLMATIMHTLLDIGQFRIARNLPRDLVQHVTSPLAHRRTALNRRPILPKSARRARREPVSDYTTSPTVQTNNGQPTAVAEVCSPFVCVTRERQSASSDRVARQCWIAARPKRSHGHIFRSGCRLGVLEWSFVREQNRDD